MKKAILGSLVVILALTATVPVLAQEDSASLTRIAQVKNQVELDVVNTSTGIAIGFTINEGPIEPTLHLIEIYVNELVGREWSAKDRVNVSTELVPNGFAVNIDGTQPQFVEKIQKRAAKVNLPTRINNLLLQFLASHGVK